MGTFISIIIPTYNEADTIAGLVSSIRTSSIGVGYEIIVVDGGSTDDTMQEAVRSNVKFVKSPVKGRGAQLNFGAQHASGQVLFFLHADSLPPHNLLFQISKTLDDGYDAGCFRLKFDTNNLFLRANAWFTRFNVNAVRFGDQGLFVTRELFEKTGGYRNDMVVLEDQEMVKRLRRFGARFRVIPDYMITSARKYLENGPLRLQFTFLLVWINYHRGKSQKELVQLYKNRINDIRIHETDTGNVAKLTDDFYKKPNSGQGENTAG
jgi:rSAM/selenodomain-associated transferase 2